MRSWTGSIWGRRCYPIIGKTDTERRVVINTVGPVWEGNQVWLILGGGAIFAAWPMLYAVAFLGLLFRHAAAAGGTYPASGWFQIPQQIAQPIMAQFLGWRAVCRRPGAGAGLGVAFGNVLQGVPFTFDQFLRMTYTGSFFGLFNPFALLCGIISVAMLVMHGGAYVACKTRGNPCTGATRRRYRRARDDRAVRAGRALGSRLNGYVVTSFAGTGAPSDMMAKTVTMMPGGLFANYGAAPIIFVVPAMAFLGAMLTLLLLRQAKRPG